jgi:hypothetical protein
VAREPLNYQPTIAGSLRGEARIPSPTPAAPSLRGGIGAQLLVEDRRGEGAGGAAGDGAGD